jgi:prepilin-type N-terminal cleavage/methylation domain-containing protein
VRTAGARREAFTLLEVMAAVLILGLLYATLATAAIRGLRSEGVSRRKIEASLIADRFLADLEAQLALGQVPPTGSEEQDVDVYRVVVSSQPFDPTPILEAIAAVEKERGIDRRPRSTTDERPSSMEVGAPSVGAPAEDLLAAPRPGQEGRLRRVDVTVTWQDGEREEVVTRTTFAFDTAGLESLFPEKGAGGAAGDTGDDASSGGDDDSTPSLDRSSRNRPDRGRNRNQKNMPTLPVQQPPPSER